MRRMAQDGQLKSDGGTYQPAVTAVTLSPDDPEESDTLTRVTLLPEEENA
jgi:hypothetical protein